MRCNRCGFAVPEWLWLGDDHPVIVQQERPMIFRTDNFEDNTFNIRVESKVSVQMCSDVNVRPPSDFIDIGPECFANKDELVISWKGSNYYKACGRLVTGTINGSSTSCLKRVNHYNACEDYDGNTRD